MGLAAHSVSQQVAGLVSCLQQGTLPWLSSVGTHTHTSTTKNNNQTTETELETPLPHVLTWGRGRGADISVRISGSSETTLQWLFVQVRGQYPWEPA